MSDVTTKTRIAELYDKISEDEDFDGTIDDLLGEVVTRIIEVPEIRQAVILAALRVDAYIKEDNPDTVGDIPWYVLWAHLMSTKDTLN